MVNTRRPTKETRPEFFSGHVAPVSHTNEPVTSTQDRRPRDEGASTPHHRPPMKRPPKGPSQHILSTLSGQQAPELGKHVPEVGLEPGSRPRKHWEVLKTCRVRLDPADVRLSPSDKVCTLCTPPFLTTSLPRPEMHRSPSDTESPARCATSFRRVSPSSSAVAGARRTASTKHRHPPSVSGPETPRIMTMHLPSDISSSKERNGT